MTGLIYPPSASIDLRGGQLKKGSLRQGYAYDGEDKKTQGRTETVNSLTLVLGSIDRMGAGRLVVETVEWRFSGDPEPFAVWHCLMRADPVR